MKKSMKNKVIAAIGAVAIGVAGVAGGFALNNPEPCPVYDFEAIQEMAFNDGVASVVIPEPEVITETISEVVYETEYVDNGNLDMVLQYLEDKSIFDDAADIVRDIEREDAALELALSELNKELADELENADIVSDERDVDIIRVYSDLDEYELVDADYDAEEFLFKIEIKVKDEDTDEKFKVVAEVSVEDGEATIEDVYREKSLLPFEQ